MSDFTSRPEPADAARALKSRLEMLVEARWFLFALLAFAFFYEPFKNDLLPKLTGVKLGPVEASFIVKQLTAIDAGECKNGESRRPQDISERRRLMIRDRARELAERLQDSHILWVDDHQSWNKCERDILAKLDIDIDTPSTNLAALTLLSTREYDLIISDMGRDSGKVKDGNPAAGLRLLTEIRSNPRYHPKLDAVPFIFYTGSFDESLPGVPDGAFAVAHRPDFLIHYVFDALERGGAPYPAGTQRLVRAGTTELIKEKEAAPPTAVKPGKRQPGKA